MRAVYANSKLFVIPDQDVEATQLLQRVKPTCPFPVPSSIAIARIHISSRPYMYKRKDLEV